MGLVADKTAKKKKPRVNHEPRSAHGRAVKKPRVKPGVNHEPRSAYGRAVKELKPAYCTTVVKMQTEDKMNMQTADFLRNIPFPFIES